MPNQLTTIAALPQAGGCMSSLPAEVGEAKKLDRTIEDIWREFCYASREIEPLPYIGLGAFAFM